MTVITNNLFLKIFENLDNHENAILGKECLFNIFKLLMLVADDKTLEEINQQEKTRNAIINEVSNTLPSSFETKTLSCIFPQIVADDIDINFVDKIKNIMHANNATTFKIVINNGENIEDETKNDTIDATHLLMKYIFYSKTIMNGKWKYPFVLENTRDLNFSISPNEEIKVPMMKRTYTTIKTSLSMNFGDLTCNVYRFPYTTNGVVMLTILPSEISTVKELTNHIIPNMGNVIKMINASGVDIRYDNIYMPKFKFERSYKLNGALNKIPELSLFIKDGANYHKMFKKDSICGQSMRFIYFESKVEIENDETGTQVKAVGLCCMTDSCCVQVQNNIYLDRPFVYCICDEINNRMLYLGTITKPEYE